MPVMCRQPPKPLGKAVCLPVGGAGEYPPTVIRRLALTKANDDEWSAIGAASLPSAYPPPSSVRC